MMGQMSDRFKRQYGHVVGDGDFDDIIVNSLRKSAIWEKDETLQVERAKLHRKLSVASSHGGEKLSSFSFLSALVALAVVIATALWLAPTLRHERKKEVTGVASNTTTNQPSQSQVVKHDATKEEREDKAMTNLKEEEIEAAKIFLVALAALHGFLCSFFSFLSTRADLVTKSTRIALGVAIVTFREQIEIAKRFLVALAAVQAFLFWFFACLSTRADLVTKSTQTALGTVLLTFWIVAVPEDLAEDSNIFLVAFATLQILQIDLLCSSFSILTTPAASVAVILTVLTLAGFAFIVTTWLRAQTLCHQRKKEIAGVASNTMTSQSSQSQTEKHNSSKEENEDKATTNLKGEKAKAKIFVRDEETNNSIRKDEPKENKDIFVQTEKETSFTPSSTKEQVHLNASAYDIGLVEEETAIIDNTNNETLLSTTLSGREQDDVARDAEKTAQTIKIYQATFANHAVDYPELAVQCALKREESLRENRLRQESELRRLQIEYQMTHLKEEQKERRHQEKMTTMKYDSRWREKLEQAYKNCQSRALNSAMGSFFFSVACKSWQQASVWDLIAMICPCTMDDTAVASASWASPWLYRFHYLLALNIDTCYFAYILRGVAVLPLTGTLHFAMTRFKLPSVMHNAVNLIAFIYLFPQLWSLSLIKKLLADSFLEFIYHLFLLAFILLWLFYSHCRRKQELESLGVSVDRQQIDKDLTMYRNNYLWVVSVLPIFATFMFDVHAQEFLYDRIMEMFEMTDDDMAY